MTALALAVGWARHAYTFAARGSSAVEAKVTDACAGLYVVLVILGVCVGGARLALAACFRAVAKGVGTTGALVLARASVRTYVVLSCTVVFFLVAWIVRLAVVLSIDRRAEDALLAVHLHTATVAAVPLAAVDSGGLAALQC